MPLGPDAAAQADVIAFLSNPTSYGQSSPVERCETHGAIVFLVGDFAYKLKRSVRYQYMDYSTPERRGAMCKAEFAINCRIASELYRSVQPIVREETGAFHFGSDTGADAAADWVIVMRRFPQCSLFGEMCKSGILTAQLVRRLAEEVAAFHAKAEPRQEFGGAGGILRVMNENATMLRSFAGRPFDPAIIDRFDSLVREAHCAAAPLLEDRRAVGCVRRCHGDLHLNNICLLDGKPVLFDAIEFSEDFASIDVLYDLALLLMDFEHRNRRDLANILLNRYLEITADYAGVAVLPLFLGCRAAIRAHVAAAAGSVTNDSERAEEAAILLQQAIGYLRSVPAMLVVTAGYSGVGKSTLAKALAPEIGCAPGAIILRSDVIRKRQFRVDELSKLPQEAYSTEANAGVYAAITAAAATLLASGHSVIADAAFGLRAEREVIGSVGRHLAAKFCPFWLEAAPNLLERRLSARTQDASDAEVEVLHRQLGWFERPVSWNVLDASENLDCVLQRARSVIHGEGLSTRAPESGSTQTR